MQIHLRSFLICLIAYFASVYSAIVFDLPFDERTLSPSIGGMLLTNNVDADACFVNGYNGKEALARLDGRGFVSYAADGSISPSEGTLSLWLKPRAWKQDSMLRIIHAYTKAKTKEEYVIIALQKLGSDIYGYLYTARGSEKATVLVRIPAERIMFDAWQKIDLTWDSARAAIYHNGEMTEEKSTPANLAVLGTNTFSGTVNIFPVYSASAEDKQSRLAVDDIKIESKAFPADIIRTRYASERPAGTISPTASPSQKRGALNVKDYGAMGNGMNDDTDAIQRCLIEAGAARYLSYYRGHVAAPEVFFPAGTYRISRTLVVPPCGGRDAGLSFINLRGDRAMLKQSDPSQDIVYIRLAYRNLVEGITFEGGKRQLKIWSKNRDKAHIIIRDCVFRNASGPAIDDQLRVNIEPNRKVNWIADIVEPYAISTNAAGLPIVTALDEEQWRIAGYISTCMRISRCTFDRSMQALSVWADWTFMDDCRIETHPDMTGPAMLVGGTLILENIEGIGHDTGKGQWWITLDPRRTQLPAYGNASIDLKNVRLRTDTKTGWVIVRNETKYNRSTQPAIFADDCVFQSAGTRGIIHLTEIPNQIANGKNGNDNSAHSACIDYGKLLKHDILESIRIKIKHNEGIHEHEQQY